MNIQELTSFCTTLLHGDLEHGVFCTRIDHKAPWFAVRWRGIPVHLGRKTSRLRDYYISTSTHVDYADGSLRKLENSWKALHFIVLDDIGTGEGAKAAVPKAPPTYIIETSKDCYQYGYLLSQPITDMAEADALIKAIYGSKITDQGGAMRSKYVRLPVGHNIKPDRHGFAERIVLCDPSVTYDGAAALCAALGVPLGEPVAARAPVSLGVPVDDPLFDFLVSKEQVLAPVNADGWATVICPWWEEHSDEKKEAGYSPLGKGKYEDKRVFNCFHDHCQQAGRTFDAYYDALVSQYGEAVPAVARSDALSALITRFGHVMSSDEVIFRDTGRREKYAGWARQHSYLIGKTTGATAWLRHHKTRKFIDCVFDPTKDTEFKVGDDWYANRYRGLPVGGEEISDVSWFTSHIEYLCGEHASLVLDWIAYKLQNPGARSYAIVMVATTQGIGRSWVGEILRQVWGDTCKNIPADDLLGTSTQAVYTDWLDGALLVVCDETLGEAPRWDRNFSHYNQLKEKVDFSPKPHRFRRKTQHNYFGTLWANFLLFTNYADAIALDDGDRRFFVLRNPATKREGWDFLWNVCAKDPRYANGLRTWLLNRDVSAFKPAEAPYTLEKERMTDAGRTLANTVFIEAMELCPDVVTLAQWQRAVVLTDSEFASHSGAMIKKQFAKFYPTERRQLKVNGKNEKFRIVRNVERWYALCARWDDFDRELIRKELERVPGSQEGEVRELSTNTLKWPGK